MSSPYTGATAAGADPQGTSTPTRRTTQPTTAATWAPPPPRPKAVPTSRATRSELIGEVTKDLSTLMRQELELAKVENMAEARGQQSGRGHVRCRRLRGYMVLMFLSIALWWALSHLVGHSWSALIVAVLWGIVGAVAFVMGKKKFQQVNPKPERTIDTLSQVPGRPQAQLTPRP